jgi:hypothetical protein
MHNPPGRCDWRVAWGRLAPTFERSLAPPHQACHGSYTVSFASARRERGVIVESVHAPPHTADPGDLVIGPEIRAQVLQAGVGQHDDHGLAGVRAPAGAPRRPRGRRPQRSPRRSPRSEPAGAWRRSRPHRNSEEAVDQVATRTLVPLRSIPRAAPAGGKNVPSRTRQIRASIVGMPLVIA